MHKHYFSLIAVTSLVTSAMHAMETPERVVPTMVTVTNKSNHDIAKVMIKTLLVDAEKSYKGFVFIEDLHQGTTKSIDLKKTYNKEKKEDGTPSKWRTNNPTIPVAAAAYLDMNKLQGCKVRTVQPQKKDKETYASRWKNTQDEDVYNFLIEDNDKKETKKTKKGAMVQRLLKITTQK